ncbi:MAG: orotate phosphoribosyltransferase [Gemmatimonadetes bacterium]|nr:MAG: orotate phosphoribosyltransferase [Gemmatimonadota bacterium]PHX96596.1 MAG: orotate phosphoribosyltransferase [Gemmatimonadota bacterium]
MVDALTPKLSPGNLRDVTPHDRLISLLAERSVRRGTFTLASGKQSSVYVDARLTTMSPEGLATIGPLALERIRAAGLDPDAVGGLTLGADPVAYAIAYASALAGSPLRAFTVRKEAKVHGTGKLIEGPFTLGDRVVIVEDVITTGGSALRAIDAVRAAGGIIIGVLAVVDREEGGQEALAAAGVPIVALATASEVLSLVP